MNGEVPIRLMDVARVVYEIEGREGDLWELLESEGFEGPFTHRTRSELAKYARRVLPGMIRRGSLFEMVKQLGRRVDGFGAHRPSRDDIDWLADHTITRALNLFFTMARKKEGWKPGNGTRMTTFFIGACALSFSGTFRLFQRETQADEAFRRSTPIEGLISSHFDHEEGVSDAMETLDIKGIDAEIMSLMLEGHSQNEIAEQLALTTGSIEGRLYRLRKRLEDHMLQNRLWKRRTP
jgi:hypothetical protein